MTPDARPRSTSASYRVIPRIVNRVLFATDASEAPPVDQYDLMIVDTCRRGYLIDREMSDAELPFRGKDD